MAESSYKFIVTLDSRQAIAEAGRFRHQMDAALGRPIAGGSTYARGLIGLRTATIDLRAMGREAMFMGTAVTASLALAGREYLQFSADAQQAGRALRMEIDLMDDLERKIWEVSSSLGAFRSEDIARGLYTWASARGETAKTEEEMNKVLKETIPIQKLAVLNQSDLASITAYTSGIIAEFNMKSSDTEKVTAALNYVSDRHLANIYDVGEAYKMVGPILADNNVTFEESAAVVGVLSDVNIKGTMAGRALRQMIISLADPSDEANEALNGVFHVSSDLGQTWKDLVFPKGEFVGMAKFTDMMAAATENMTQAEKASLLSKFATANELPAITALINRQTEARKWGINVIRAEEKIMTGAIDAEVRKYAEFRQAIDGVTIDLTSSLDSFRTEWGKYEQSDVARAKRLEQRWRNSIQEIGKQVTETGIPSLEKMMDVFEELVDFSEEHPGLIPTILFGAGGLMAAGTIITTLGKIGTMLGGFAGFKLLGQAAISPVGAGMVTGGVVEYLLPPEFRQRVQQEVIDRILKPLGWEGLAPQEKSVAEMILYPGVAGALVGQAGATAGMYGQAGYAALLTVMRDLGWITDEYVEAQMEAMFQTQAAGEVAQAAALGYGDMRDEAFKAFHTMRQVGEMGVYPTVAPSILPENLDEILGAWHDYVEARQEIVERANERLVEEDKKFNRDISDIDKKWLDQRRKLQDRFIYDDRRDVLRQHDQIQKAVRENQDKIDDYIRDWNTRQEEAAEDHEERIWDAVERRDARAYILEQRRYAKEVARAGKEKDEWLKRNERDHGQQLDDLRDALETQREERRLDYDRQIRELDENHDEQLDRRRLAHQEQLDELRNSKQKEFDKLNEAFADQLAAIQGWDTEIAEERRRHYEELITDFDKFLEDWKARYREFEGLSPTASDEGLGIGATVAAPEGLPQMRGGAYGLGGAGLMGLSTLRAGGVISLQHTHRLLIDGPGAAQLNPMTEQAIERVFEEVFGAAARGYGSGINRYVS